MPVMSPENGSSPNGQIPARANGGMSLLESSFLKKVSNILRQPHGYLKHPCFNVGLLSWNLLAVLMKDAAK